MNFVNFDLIDINSSDEENEDKIHEQNKDKIINYCKIIKEDMYNICNLDYFTPMEI